MSRQRIRRDNSEEALSKTVRLDGVGEDPAVRAMLSEDFVKGSNKDALDIALALQQLVRGQNSIMDNQTQLSGEVARLRQRMDEMDKTAEKYEADRVGFIQEVLDKAQGLKDPTNKTLVKGMNEFSDALAKAQAEAVHSKLHLIEVLKTMPKETVLSPGELVTVSGQGGQPTIQIMNEIVRIKDLEWVIPAGIPTEVPQVVAEILRNRRQSEQETKARQEVMAKNLSDDQLKTQWNEINSKFSSPAK